MCLRIILVAMLLVGIGACSKQDSFDPQSKDNTSTSHSTPSSWELVKAKIQGGYVSAKFPSKPKKQTKSQNTQAGRIQVILYLTKHEGNEFILATTKYPSIVFKHKTIEQMLDDARDGGVARIRGKLDEERKISKDGRPGRYLKVLSTDRRKALYALFYVDKQTLIMLVTTSDQTKEMPTSIKTFFNSVDFK